MEELRSDRGLNFIYLDELVEGIKIDSFHLGNDSIAKIEKLLKRNGLSYKHFGQNTYVLYKTLPEIIHEDYAAVITGEEILELDSSQILIKPVLLSNPKPSYPRWAVNKGIEGVVRIKFLVDKKGRVSNSLILESSGYPVLDSAANNFVFSLKYSPAEVDGKPHNVWVSMAFEYILND